MQLNCTVSSDLSMDQADTPLQAVACKTKMRSQRLGRNKSGQMGGQFTDSIPGSLAFLSEAVTTRACEGTRPSRDMMIKGKCAHYEPVECGHWFIVHRYRCICRENKQPTEAVNACVGSNSNQQYLQQLGICEHWLLAYAGSECRDRSRAGRTCWLHTQRQ